MFAENQINQLLEAALGQLNGMIDTSKIIGAPLRISDEQVLIPISKVSFGYGAAGSEFNQRAKRGKKREVITFDAEFGGDLGVQPAANFGGGTGGGVSITPRAFIVINKDTVEIKAINQPNQALDKISEFLMRFINKNSE